MGMKNKMIEIQEMERQHAQSMGLTVNAFHLACLVYANEGRNLKFFALTMGVTQAGLGWTMDKLAKMGLAKTTQSPHDKRSVALHLTKAGKEIMGTLLGPYNE